MILVFLSLFISLKCFLCECISYLLDASSYNDKMFDDPENFIHKDLILDEAIKEKINDLGMCTAGKFFQIL